MLVNSVESDFYRFAFARSEMPTPSDGFRQETPSTDYSDSETDSADHEDSYRPISFHSDSGSDSEPDNSPGSEPDNHAFHILPNGHQNPNPNFFSIDLNGGPNGEQADETESEEEEEAAATERVESALRAFGEDEGRRSAPLAPEIATRIMDAMRGVSFLGSAPDWAGRVPEDRWLDRLRSLRSDDGKTAPGGD